MRIVHRRNRLRSMAAVGVAVAALGAAGGVQAAGAAEKPPPREPAGAAKLPADVQQALKDFRQVTPGPGFVAQSAYYAKGTQTYTCSSTSSWSAASTPEANLVRLPFGGDTIHHYGGPRWAAEDGSILRGEVPGRVSVPKTGTIPWLLLNIAEYEGTPGALSPVTNISRILTSGGLAPVGACSPGATSASPYKAVYVFWVARPKS